MAEPWELTDRQLAFRRLICYLTDHRYTWHPSPPRCERCGADEYWPTRATISGAIERFRYAVRHRLINIRRALDRCPHCGHRGCDCIPF